MNNEKREKRQSVPQPLKQAKSNHHYHHKTYQGDVVPPPQLYARVRHRNSNNRDSSLSPCSSDVIMSHSLNASSGSLSSVSSDRSASTDCVEYVTDVPFAGKEIKLVINFFISFILLEMHLLFVIMALFDIIG